MLFPAAGGRPETPINQAENFARRLARAGERMLDSRLVGIRCPIGGIGRRARLKIEFRKKCWFDPGMGHQISLNKWILDFAHAPKGEGMSLGG